MKKTVDCRVYQDRTRMTFAIERPVKGSGGNNHLSNGVVLALQGAFGAVPLAFAMRMLVLLLAALIVSASLIRGEIKTPENAPIEITSTGETTYENGLATAHDNVAIHIGNTDIYADYAQYNSTTHEVELRGNVRIYRDASLYIAENGIYNTETKKIRAITGRTQSQPYFLAGNDVTSIEGDNAYLIKGGTFTTHDSSKPDFRLHAHKIRVYEDDRVILLNVTAYVGNVPVFWFPYLYQSLDNAFSFSISPAYYSTWGPSLLTQVTFPITDNIQARVRLDYFGRRGPAIGLEPTIEYGKDQTSVARIKTFYINDQNPEINQTDIPRVDVPESRYRATLEDHTDFTDSLHGITNITKLNDQYAMQEFFHGEIRTDPVSDNVIAETKVKPVFTLT